MPPITDKDIAEVKRLAAAGQVANARKLLKKFDDDRAKAALKKFNQRYPEPDTPKQAKNQQRLLFGGMVAAIIIASIALVGVLIGLKRQQDALQPISDLFNATALPTWTLPYSSPVEAMEWLCLGYYEQRGITGQASEQACPQEAELFYQENTAAVDACYASSLNYLDFLECALDQNFSFDGRFIQDATS